MTRVCLHGDVRQRHQASSIVHIIACDMESPNVNLVVLAMLTDKQAMEIACLCSLMLGLKAGASTLHYYMGTGDSVSGNDVCRERTLAR